MDPWKSLYSFNRQERNGIFYLLLCIVLLQIAYYLIVHLELGAKEAVFHVDPATAARLVEMADSSRHRYLPVAYPFNPNFISDFKGYVLGLSIEQLDRIKAFRASGNYMGSSAEFQEVTGISDTLLSTLAPQLRFGNRQPARKEKLDYQPGGVYRVQPKGLESELVRDLNIASSAELRTINGIGPVLSERIIRFRQALGGFLTERQLLDVYGLDREVAGRAMDRFRVLQPPVADIVNINTANAEELARNVYITFGLAHRIVRYREQFGPFTSLDQLTGLEGFPSEKIDRISLYLTLE